MLKEERQNRILELIQENEFLNLEKCSELLKTSVSTIRRDFQEMSELGLIERVHGGAKMLSRRVIEPNIIEKLEKNKNEKEVIASSAADLVQEGDTIFIDAGSTTFAMIKYLKGKNVTVVTNGLTHIDHLINYQIKSYVIGGLIKDKTKALVGKEAIDSIRRYHFDKCFLGANAIDKSFGCSTPDPNEAMIKEEVIRHSDQSFVLADQNKFNQKSFVKFCNLNEVTILTDVMMKGYEKIKTIRVGK